MQFLSMNVSKWRLVTWLPYRYVSISLAVLMRSAKYIDAPVACHVTFQHLAGLHQSLADFPHDYVIGGCGRCAARDPKFP